jgi:hypothetical protein
VEGGIHQFCTGVRASARVKKSFIYYFAAGAAALTGSLKPFVFGVLVGSLRHKKLMKNLINSLTADKKSL